MLILLQILLWIILALLIIVVLALVTPLRMQFTLQSEPVRKARVDIRPFAGAIGRIPVFDSTRPRKPKKAKVHAEKEPKKERRSRFSIKPGALREIPSVLARLFQAFEVETLAVDGEFGLGDPADTGCLYGQLTPLIYAAGANVQLRPNFQVRCLRGSVDACVRVTPVMLLGPVAGFLIRNFGSAR